MFSNFPCKKLLNKRIPYANEVLHFQKDMLYSLDINKPEYIKNYKTNYKTCRAEIVKTTFMVKTYESGFPPSPNIS